MKISRIEVQSTVERYLPGPAGNPVQAPELHAIAQYVRAGRCALFVGAGLSAGAGLPTWDTLMKRLVERVTPWAVADGIVPDSISIVDDEKVAWHEPEVVKVKNALGVQRFERLITRTRRQSKHTSSADILALALEVVGHDARERAELTRLLQQKRYPELAGFCRDRLGSDAFAAEVRRALTPRHGLTDAHGHIARTPFTCVVTTNFDTLLEQAYAHFGDAGVPRAPTGVDLTQLGTLLLDGSFFVLKAHGDALRPETMVFSSDDYRRLIHATPAFQAVFSSILMTNALLFVGYSLSDTNFRLLLDQQFTVFNGDVPPRYALLSGVGIAEEAILWRTARLQVLSYPEGQHNHVDEFLGALATAVAGKPTRNTKRATSSAPTVSVSPSRPDTTLSLSVRDGHLTIKLAHARRTQSQSSVWTVPLAERQLDAVLTAVRLAIHAHLQKRTAAAEIADACELLTGVLPPELLRALRRLKPNSALQLVCAPGVHRIPWEWITISGKPLCLRHAIARSPVSIFDTARGQRGLGASVRALIIGDAGSGQPPELPLLDGAEFEAKQIAYSLRQTLPRDAVTHISRAAATRQRILHELRVGDYDIIHFAGHAWFTDRESYFYAWDGIMLGSELTPLLSRRPPALLVMSTHFTSFLPLRFNDDFRNALLGRASTLADAMYEPLSGFAETAMRCGVGSFVGSFGEPPDLDTAEAMIAFIHELLDGHSVAGALLAARQKRFKKGDSSSLALTCVGYGEQTIFSRPARRPTLKRTRQSSKQPANRSR